MYVSSEELLRRAALKDIYDNHPEMHYLYTNKTPFVVVLYKDGGWYTADQLIDNDRLKRRVIAIEKLFKS